jgi:hypothetical protein
MDDRNANRVRRLPATLGLLAGLFTGTAAVVVAGSAVETGYADPTNTVVEATHVPALLTRAGERIELRYDAYCIEPGSEDSEASCDVSGTVFIRAGAAGRFRQLPLRGAGGASRFVAPVPEDIASSPRGFTYYAEFTASSGQATTTLPSGGASAPHRSVPLGSPVTIDLGRHEFGATARADERIAEVAWGDGADQAGLEHGRNVTPIGASAFDVDPSGSVVILDQANRRILRWGSVSRTPTRISLAIAGQLADVSLGPDGSVHVLESVSEPGRTPLVRRFDSYGQALQQIGTAERTPSQIRQGPTGPVVLQQPSGQWMPVMSAGTPIGPEDQRSRGRAGRPLRGGGEIVVLRLDNEVRVAVVGTSGVRRSWRVVSETALAEVQLADVLGDRVVLVVRVYEDDADEFVALVLDDDGLFSEVSLDAADWAETAPLGRFRLVGGSLYQLGSTPAGAFVDLFDLEVGG